MKGVLILWFLLLLASSSLMMLDKLNKSDRLFTVSSEEITLGYSSRNKTFLVNFPFDVSCDVFIGCGNGAMNYRKFRDKELFITVSHFYSKEGQKSYLSSSNKELHDSVKESMEDDIKDALKTHSGGYERDYIPLRTSKEEDLEIARYGYVITWGQKKANIFKKTYSWCSSTEFLSITFASRGQDVSASYREEEIKYIVDNFEDKLVSNK